MAAISDLNIDLNNLPELTASDVKASLSQGDRSETIILNSNKSLINNLKTISLPSSSDHSNNGYSNGNGHEAIIINGTLEVDNNVIDDELDGELWGKLFPWKSSLPTVDLKADRITVGRGSLSDVVFSSSMDFYAKLSTTQFIITKELQTSSPKKKKSKSSSKKKSDSDVTEKLDCEFVAVLEDCGSNGTFINGRKVGKGCKQVLNANDIISLLTPNNRAWMYMPSYDLSSRVFPNEVTSKYIMCKTLGGGGFGEVFQAFKLDSASWCAVKVMNKRALKADSDTDDDILLLKAEVDNLMTLSHPNVITMLDFIDTNEDAFLCLELVNGGDLFDRLENLTPDSEAWTKVIAFQLANAIDYLHRNEVIHRDIKLENVLCTKESDPPLVKLADFGLSKLIHAGTFLRTLCGTSGYIAPEIEESYGDTTYSSNVDVYSFGILIYYCMSMDEYTGALTTKNREMWSQELQSLLEGMLDKDPKKRLDSNAVLGHPWFVDSVMRSTLTEILNTHNLDIDEIYPISETVVKRGVKRSADEPLEDIAPPKARRRCIVL